MPPLLIVASFFWVLATSLNSGIFRGSVAGEDLALATDAESALLESGLWVALPWLGDEQATDSSRTR